MQSSKFLFGKFTQGWTSILRLLTMFSTLCIVLPLCSCSTTRQARSVEPSGFLNDYSLLEEGGSGQAALVYVNPNTDFTRYKSVIIDPVSVWAPEDSKLVRLDPEQLQNLVAHLQNSLTEELAKDYHLTTEPGPGTMRVRAAITEARGSKVVLDSVSTIIPNTRMLSTVTQLGVGTSVATGKAHGEVEILDSMTNERLFAGVDERYGSKAFRGMFTKWGDVKDAFDHWSSRIRERLVAERIEDGEQPVDDSQ